MTAIESLRGVSALALVLAGHRQPRGCTKLGIERRFNILILRCMQAALVHAGRPVRQSGALMGLQGLLTASSLAL